MSSKSILRTSRSTSRTKQWSRALLKLSEENKSLRRESSEMTSGRGQIAELKFADQKTQQEIVEASQNPTRIAFGHARVVFVKSDIAAVM